ncbi:MAG TPA: dihydrolipoamide acetyltransferase family protein [Solirubrobacterales bacterium]|nr:dihydrolipoamide acetyltransferase family protein [Solirubrobacterales bacterium]
MAEIVMPRLSDSMEEGTVLRWLKSAGDEVAVGDELVEIETDKANMVYESDLDGTLVEILAQEGDTLPVGDPIARVGDASQVVDGRGADAVARDRPPSTGEQGYNGGGEKVPGPDIAPAPTAAAATPGPATAPPAAGPTPSPAGAGGDGRVRASPIARRIAADRGLDLQGLQGSGPGGRIVKADVERALASGAGAAAATQVTPQPPAEAPVAPPTPAGPTPGVRERPETAKGQVEVVELTKLQQTVARRMAESKATAPHFYLQAEIDMTSAVQGRAKLKASAREGEVVPTFNDMVVKACALALREHPRANGAYRDGKIELYSRVNVGVAVAAQDALVVPTVFDADQKGLRRIATEARALAARVRDGSITPPELSGGTFTVSNLGMYGISNFGAVINTPQAGILAVGEVRARPLVTDSGEIAPRQLMGVTLACDHRILYGADGAEFLARVRELLEEPLGLAL